MKIMVIDGQGGKMGKSIVEQMKKAFPQDEILAIGTNSTATAAMLKAGADEGATGENPAIVGSGTADVILLGEITPAMAAAIGRSRAKKVLLPVNRCQHFVVGLKELPLGEYVRLAVEEVARLRDE